MRTLAIVVCLFAVTTCDEKSPVGPTVSLNQQFTLARGETASVETTNVRVQFVGVTGDSRCPADAVCIQGGDAIVHVRAAEGRTSTDYELHTGDTSRATAVHGQLRITLVQLQPYPFSGRTVGQDEYRATLTVARP